MHVYQMRSSNKSIVSATESRLQICMNALKEVSKVWLVAKMVHTLFESILGNKLLEERLQKAAGKRHKKTHLAKPKEEPQKRKFDDIDMGFPNGPPMPQVSYERSRPQTPALTPSRDVNQPHTNGGPQLSATSPHATRHPSDAFVGAASRGNTRPTTPFNPSFSFPGTPPELFLVTRNSPNISQDLWQNFQPDQLFPAETNLNMNFPSVSPIQQHSMVDPQLSSQQQGAQMMGHSVTPVSMQTGMGSNGIMNTSLAGQANDANAWAHVDAMNQQQNDETWSNSSRGQGPIVPTTLNVEDWYVTRTYSVISLFGC
jgi:hypothetical protein